MNRPQDIAQQYAAAFMAKDLKTAKSLLHEDYRFKGPMAEANGQDETLAMIENFPFVSNEENVRILEQGDTAVKRFDWHVTSPFEAVIPMTEWITVKNGKLYSCELFYDTAKFPAEAMRQMANAS